MAPSIDMTAVLASKDAARSNEDTPNVQTLERKTKDGRTLFYQLKVLQEPECARACGAGSKGRTHLKMLRCFSVLTPGLANSDRRPVDPPPVVEIRVYEGSVDDENDITFDYNAHFFLYASLEQAPDDDGTLRMHNVGTLNPPVLAGVPASGVAYLDRPHAAGYFIFPDLSVRHEGRFRLSFSLYESCKEERDFDVNQVHDPTSGVDWRMEIKTISFHVYSAKKFPGLMESTELSKTVANQGCRVRIRRDVRMRKRDAKKDGEDARARSHSHSSEHAVPTGRRTSGLDASPTDAPMYAAAPAAHRTPMTFAGDHGAPDYAAPRHYPPSGPYAAPVHSKREVSHVSSPAPSDMGSRRGSATPCRSQSVSLPPPHSALKIASLMSPALSPVGAGSKRPHEGGFLEGEPAFKNPVRLEDISMLSRFNPQSTFSRASGDVSRVHFKRFC